MKLSEIENIKLEHLKEFLNNVDPISNVKLDSMTTVYNAADFIESHMLALSHFAGKNSRFKRQYLHYIMPTFNRLKLYCLIIEKTLENEKEFS